MKKTLSTAAAQDAQIHMHNKVCITCVWFCQDWSMALEPPMYMTGNCRRNAPTMIGHPIVFTNHWCGDHLLSKKKVNAE